MVSYTAIKCGNSSAKYKIKDVKGWHQVPYKDNNLRKNG